MWYVLPVDRFFNFELTIIVDSKSCVDEQTAVLCLDTRLQNRSRKKLHHNPFAILECRRLLACAQMEKGLPRAWSVTHCSR